MDEPALVTRASLAAWSARRAPSRRISLSAARPLRLVLFFGPACMTDILHRLRRSRPSLVAGLHDVLRLERSAWCLWCLTHNLKVSRIAAAGQHRNWFLAKG